MLEHVQNGCMGEVDCVDREKQIVRVGVINTAGNVVLAVLKGIVGLASHSIAITLDAVNSLVDGMSSVIAIVGTKLAGRQADREHPFGYGRLEYLTSIVIAAVIIATGVSSLVESVRAILHPAIPNYSLATLIIVGIAALIKGVLGRYLTVEGKRLESGSLRGAGTDSLMDMCVSLATLVAAILYILFGIDIQSYLAAGIAILICRCGILLLMETVSMLLGKRVDAEIAAKVEREVRAIDEVKLASNLVLQDFGPDRLNGSVYVSVDGSMTIAEYDDVVRKVQQRVYQTCGVSLTGVTPYPDSDDSEKAAEMRSIVGRIVWSNDHVVELRGLYVDVAARTVRFDAIVDYETADWFGLRDTLVKECQAKCPGWSFNARVLPDASD